jgi:hypothetical protein
MVLFCQNDPNAEGVLTYPALVVSINRTGSVNLQVFTETVIFAQPKIPFANKLTPGYYCFRA